MVESLPKSFYVFFFLIFFTFTIVFTSYHNLLTISNRRDEQKWSENDYNVIGKTENNANDEPNKFAKLSKELNPQPITITINKLQRELARLRQRLDQIERIKNLDEKHRSWSEWQKSNAKKMETKFLPYSEKKRILITGGAGFVGSHLLDRLLFDGHEVIVADNFFTGRRANIEHWIGHPNFELLYHDVVNPLYVEVNEIYHLASPASPPHYMMNAVKTIKTNTIGTINMLGLAKRVGARILVASTSEIYGDPDIHPQSESYWGKVNPIGPRSCYDEGKRVAESLTYAYAKQEMLDVRVARIFNTYGPRMDINDGRVVSNFIKQALQAEPFTIYGDGSQTRSFQYVTDLVEGLVRLMASNYTNPVNLGNPDEHTIEDLANIILNLVQQKKVNDQISNNNDKIPNIQYLPPQPDDPKRRCPDITVAKKVLNWQPTVNLKNGLSKTIEYFRNELKLSMGTSSTFD